MTFEEMVHVGFAIVIGLLFIVIGLVSVVLLWLGERNAPPVNVVTRELARVNATEPAVQAPRSKKAGLAAARLMLKPLARTAEAPPASSRASPHRALDETVVLGPPSPRSSPAPPGDRGEPRSQAVPVLPGLMCDEADEDVTVGTAPRRAS